MPELPSDDATHPDQAPQYLAPDSILKLYDQDFDRWEFTEAHPRITPFCETLSQLGGSDVA
ncbi:MAG TPA: hypothetical protein DIU09_08430 [Hyphomonadaceae bacterium]|nr:hypothetical protein AEM38_01155 [Hyphomonadaceae bacterium UKL13-1]HCP64601.1 hypothetical protein [Hyphomonadaceae bacterium]